VIKLTSENLASYVRIALYNIGAFLITKGVLSSGSVELWSGVVLNILTFAWTLWGQRVIAKINELAKIPNLIIVAPPAVADASPANTVVSNTTSTVVAR
jgi:hypothetical protein